MAAPEKTLRSAFIWSPLLSQYLFTILLETALLTFGERETLSMTTEKWEKTLSSLTWTLPKVGYLQFPSSVLLFIQLGDFRNGASSKSSGEVLTTKFQAQLWTLVMVLGQQETSHSTSYYMGVILWNLLSSLELTTLFLVFFSSHADPDWVCTWSSSFLGLETRLLALASHPQNVSHRPETGQYSVRERTVIT